MTSISRIFPKHIRDFFLQEVKFPNSPRVREATFLFLLLAFFYIYHMDISLESLPGNDLAGHIAAFHDFKSQWLSEGKVPLWAPNRFCGMVQGLNLEKFLILPFSLFLSEIAAHKALALLALAIGVLGTYRILRLWGLDRTSAYIGGLVFAIHPFVIVDFRSYGHLSFTLTVHPWVAASDHQQIRPQ